MKARRLLLALLFAQFAMTALPARAESPAQLADRGDWAAALGGYLDRLEIRPGDAEARHGAWRAAMRLGLFDQAAALEANLDAAEREAMAGDRIALSIRYGRIDARTLRGEARYGRLDAALAQSDVEAGAFLSGETGAAVDAESARRLIDRVAALCYRNRPQDAVTLYAALVARGVDAPTWAQADVAGALLALRRPNESEVLYRRVLEKQPDDFDANLGLFYALVEREQLDAAAAHIDAFQARLPARRHRDGQPNGERWSAGVVADAERLYADRLAEAQQRVAARLDATPFNSEARTTEASLHLARGWPRRGEADLRRNLGRDPENPSLHADRAETLLALQRWDSARGELARATDLAADAAPVLRANRTFALHDRRELYVEAGYGQGQPSGPYGNRDWRIDSWLYSSPLGERWRMFAHNFSSSGDFHGSRTNWVRTGAGVEWREGDWRATAEANAGAGERVGALASLRWQPDDHLRFDAAAESLSNDIPLQAVRAGITASRAGVSAEWRAHESRKFLLSSSYSDFSDGNGRNSVNVAWFERWLSGPRWMLETTLGADSSHNSLGYAAAYFNPPRDRSVWLSGAVEHLAWRDYDRSFRHRLALTVGDYWQSGFANGAIDAIEYQHRWELDRDLSLRYGVGRALRPYDGVREARNFATLTLLWRF